jgi:hypothetical protein
MTVKRLQSFRRYTKKQFSKTKTKKYLLTNLNFMLTNLDC